MPADLPAQRTRMRSQSTEARPGPRRQKSRHTQLFFVHSATDKWYRSYDVQAAHGVAVIRTVGSEEISRPTRTFEHCRRKAADRRENARRHDLQIGDDRFGQLRGGLRSARGPRPFPKAFSASYCLPYPCFHKSHAQPVLRYISQADAQVGDIHGVLPTNSFSWSSAR